MMKDRAMKLFGLFMTLALLAGLAGVGAISNVGVSAASTSSLQWTPVSVPDETHKQLYPDSDIGPMAITPDGGTLFASVLFGGNWSMWKSTDGGYTWRETGFPTSSTEIVAVELSPSWSSDSTVYVATTNGVYKSKDRGNTFTALSMTDVSGTIASLDTGKDAEGKVQVIIGTSADVYLFDDGWVAQGIGAYSVLAVAFSPDYAVDEAIVAVVNSATQTIVRTKSSGVWGSIDNVAISGNTSDRACIGLPSDYSTTAPSLFVGLSAASNSGDVFSIAWDVSSFAVTDLNVSDNGSSSSVNIWSMAVNGSFSEAVILAGAEAPTSKSYGSILVFASSNGGDSWVPNDTDIANKQPTGESRAAVVKADSAIYVGTRGNQSAVSAALLGGYTSWNQRGLIDTSIDIVTDMVVSGDYFSDSTMYITTNDSDAASLWITQTGGSKWERIFCSTLTGSPAACTFDMVRLGADTAVVAQSGTKAIWLSTNGGTTFSNKSGAQTIGAGLGEDITAFTLNGADNTFYVGGANGSVSKSAGGISWTKADSASEIPADETVVDLVLASDSRIYVGTSGGGAYGASTGDLLFIPVGSDAPGTSGDVVRLALDAYEGDYIYVGIAGSAGTKGIWRCYLGEDEADWERIADGAAVGNISSLVCAEDNGILYAISPTDGIGYRCVRPTATKTDPVFQSFSAGLETGEKVKRGLKVISGSNLLFAIGGAGDAYNRIWTASDEIIKMKLLAPANGAMAGDIWQNGSYAGKARVALSWKTVADADSYEIQIASDADFINLLDNSCFESGTQATTNNVTMANLWLGSKYYWRIRVAAPYLSQWSDNWSFTTPLGPKASLPELLSPAAGQSDVILKPILQWNNSLAATSYELVLTENCDPNNSVLNLVGDKKLGQVTAYQVQFELKPGTNYCWKVRGLSDVTTSQWSDMGTFTTMPTPVIAEEEGTPVWVWIIIAISAVLVVGVVMLIVRTRRPI